MGWNLELESDVRKWAYGWLHLAISHYSEKSDVQAYVLGWENINQVDFDQKQLWHIMN